MSPLETIAVIVGVVSGVSGLVLGILNYLHQRDTSRPRLVVRLHAPSAHDLRMDAVVQVCNVGRVPVVLDGTIWFQRTRRQEKDPFCLTNEVITNIEKWPYKFKPQDAVWLQFNPDGLPNELGRAFVKTVVGDKFKASRRDMREFARDRRKWDGLRKAPPT